MDAFIAASYDLCTQLLPILGAIVLVFLIVLITKVISLVKNYELTLKNANGTIGSIDKSLEKIQKPLDVAVKISGSVDKAHDATLEAIDSAKEYIAKGTETVKAKVQERLNSKATENDEEKEPSPEDIIGD